MRVNMNKTMVMIIGDQQNVRQKAVRWPCSVCGSGIGNNSIQCTSCQKWLHRKCSDIKDSMYKVMKTFVCRGCVNPVTSTGRTSVYIGVKANLELVDKFCYLQCTVGVRLSVDGDAHAAMETRVRIGWNKFKQLLPLLTIKDISLKVRGRLYSSWSSMLHGSETWPIRKKNEVALQRAETRIVRWMCGMKLQDRIASKGLRGRLGLDDIMSVLQQNRLQWYGHVLRKVDSYWVKKCMEYEVADAKPIGRPKESCKMVVCVYLGDMLSVDGDADAACGWRC